MSRAIRPYLSSTERTQIWERWRAGEPIWRISRALERRSRTICDELDRGGGFSPRPRRRALRSLSRSDREEISRGLAAQRSLRSIAHGLCRSASSISREVRRNGGAGVYRAGRADQRAWDQARRPKVCRLAQHRRLCERVAEKLQLQWSPQQIAAWLVRDYPTDHSMRVSHETIYRTLFVQARGVLKRELTVHLRSHRKRHGARHAEGAGARGGSIVGELSIRERPAEAADRAVPGHWEGDLLCGSKGSQIATLVERHSRFVMLIKLADKNSVRVARALAEKIQLLPKESGTPFLGLGPWHRDGLAPTFHAGDRRAGVLLRPPQSVAAGLEREHQRSVAAVLSKGPGPVGVFSGPTRRRGRPTQRPSASNPRLAEPRRTLRANRCVNRLRPPDAACEPQGWFPASPRRPPGSPADRSTKIPRTTAPARRHQRGKEKAEAA
jgi:IS30 family transposase